MGKLTDELANVQRHYGADVFLEQGGVVHRCAGAEVYPGAFLLWPVCGQGDVPSGEDFKSPSAEVTCPHCRAALTQDPTND